MNRLSRVVRLAALGVIALALLGACSKQKSDEMFDIANPNINEPFNPDEAAYVLRPGTATVAGRIYAGPQPGEFASVRLVPVTSYSNKVMQILFQGSKAYHGGKPLDQVDPRYREHMRYAKADANGQYILHGVPAGRYYVYGTAANYDKGYGFGHMETLDVTDGQKYTVDLDGQ